MAKNNKKLIPEEEINNMRMFHREMWANLLETAQITGIKVISDDTCCKLLAWAFVLGGGTEQSTHNIKLNTAIAHAQHRANLFGGNQPTLSFIESIKNYSQDLMGFIKTNLPRPAWLTELEISYNIAHYKLNGEFLPNQLPNQD